MESMKHVCLLALLLCCSTPALAIYKCDTGGNITYSDQPCPDGKILNIDGAPPADAERASKQAAREKNLLKQIEADRQKQEAKEEKARQRMAKSDAAKQKKCTALERRQKWVNEDTFAATGKSADRLKRKARRIAEQYQEECSGTNQRGLSIAG